MNKSVMVENLVNYFCDGNKARFAQILGIRPQSVNGWIVRNSFDAELIFSKFKGVSAAWLLTGEGEMVEGSQSENTYKANVSVDSSELIELRAENKQLRERVADLRALLGLNGEKEHFSVQVNTNKKE